MELSAIRRGLPGPVKRLANGGLNMLDPLLTRGLRNRMDKPLPGRVLRARIGEPDARAFLESGRRAARELEDLLAGAGRPISDFDSIWDFGSGSGRILTELETAPGARLHAGDVDDQAIAWLASAHPEITALPNSAHPPTSFADRSFDLIYSISVFTHISEASQDLWLAEIARLLRPGGVAVLTVMGPGLLDRYRAGRRPGMTASQHEALVGGDLDRSGILFTPEPLDRWNRWRYRRTEADYGLTFHSESYLHRHWSNYLSVDSVVPECINWEQTAVLCSPLPTPG